MNEDLIEDLRDLKREREREREIDIPRPDNGVLCVGHRGPILPGDWILIDFPDVPGEIGTSRNIEGTVDAITLN